MSGWPQPKVLVIEDVHLSVTGLILRLWRSRRPAERGLGKGRTPPLPVVDVPSLVAAFCTQLLRQPTGDTGINRNIDQISRRFVSLVPLGCLRFEEGAIETMRPPSGHETESAQAHEAMLSSGTSSAAATFKQFLVSASGIWSIRCRRWCNRKAVPSGIVSVPGGLVSIAGAIVS